MVYMKKVYQGLLHAVSSDAMWVRLLTVCAWWSSVFAASASEALSSSAATFSLSNLEWTLRNQNGSIAIPVRLYS